MSSNQTPVEFFLFFMERLSSFGSPTTIFYSVSSSAVKAPGPVLCLHGNPSTGTAVLQLTTGEVLRVSSAADSSEGCVLSPWLLDSGSSLKYEGMVHCEKMELALFNGKVLWVGYVV